MADEAPAAPTAAQPAPAAPPPEAAKPAVEAAAPPAQTKESGKPPTPPEVSDAAKTLAAEKARKNEERHAHAVLDKARRLQQEARERERKLADERKQLEEARKAHEADVKDAAELRRLSKLAKENPLALLEAAGIPQSAVLDAMVKGDKRTPEELAQAVVQKELAARDAKAKAEAERAEKERAAALERQNREVYENTLKQIGDLITKNPDRYEFCAERPDSAALAMKVIEAYYVQTSKAGRPEILPFDEALDTIEADLEAKHEAFLSKSKKLKAKQEAAEAERKKAQDAEAAKKKEAEAGASSRTRRNMFAERTKSKPTDAAPAATPPAGDSKPPTPPQPELTTKKGRRALARQFDEQLAKLREA